MIRRPPRSTLSSSSAASDVYKRQMYLKRLQALKDEFLPSLMHFRDLIEMTGQVHDFQELVSTLETLHQIHQTVYMNLSKVLYSTCSTKHEVADVVLLIADTIQNWYSRYLVHIGPFNRRAGQLLQSCPEFASALEQATSRLSASDGSGLGMTSFTLMPIQRMAGYGALSERLSKLTPPQDVHKQARLEAHQHLVEAMQGCDEAVGQYKQVLQVKQQLLKGDTGLSVMGQINQFTDQRMLFGFGQRVWHKGILELYLDGSTRACIGWVFTTVSYTHLRAHETPEHLVCRLLLEKKKNNKKHKNINIKNKQDN
eukprot:TRINITY_DN10653_c0_g1_i1.p1 TRINITY_DN10653_c0_g1~~TRINITY_DN10653_c0_g1_i1.p1  ORF type:complete len:312 (-),score=82.50 TRINITY_DN10653_c0_g1_i1:20-955(-)